jgi:hypothetical protein
MPLVEKISREYSSSLFGIEVGMGKETTCVTALTALLASCHQI